MAPKMNGLSRELIIHPGETLKEILINKNMSQQELALRTGVTAKHISTVLNGEKNISASFANKLEYALGVDASFWMTLQTNYDKEILAYEDLHAISSEELAIVKKLKDIIQYLTQKDMIRFCAQEDEKLLQLRKFFNVSNLTAIPRIAYCAAYRAQTKTKIDKYVLFGWQSVCEHLTEKMEVASIAESEQAKRILLRLADIKQCMMYSPDKFIPLLQQIFSSCGIAFCVVPSFKGAPVQGFIKYMGNNKTIVCMTFRQKRADIFWFTLFHEIGHIINGDTKQKFIDFESVENERELKADSFAQNILLDRKQYKLFKEQGDYSLQAIMQFAEEQQVLPCIVVGRLKKEKILTWSAYNAVQKIYDVSTLL